jgi:hypothetical protein
MICFDLDRDQIDVLTLGCGDDPYVVSPCSRLSAGSSPGTT